MRHTFGTTQGAMLENLVPGLVVVLTAVLVLPFVRVWAWCLADVVHCAADFGTPNKAQWLVALLLFSVFAIPAYVTFGPGRERWDPRMMWWPWKRL
jgi:hypothetical protein